MASFLCSSHTVPATGILATVSGSYFPTRNRMAAAGQYSYWIAVTAGRMVTGQADSPYRSWPTKAGPALVISIPW